MEIYLLDEAKKILKGFKFAKFRELKNLKDAKDFFDESSSLVLKVLSKQAIHKTEFGFVKVCKKQEEIEEKWFEIISNIQKANIKNYKIIGQEFVDGIELIVGIKRDETFGHLILFGLGGIFVEIIKDYSLRICPITKKDAKEMINEIKAKKILFGYRGKKANLKFIEKFLVKISKLPLKLNVKELDINPLIINEKEGKIVDARIIL